MDKNSMRTISDGDVVLWVENGTSIHIKAATAQGDPVELSADEANDLIAALTELVELLGD